MGSWKEFGGEFLPDDAVIVGREKDSGEYLFLARVAYDRGLYPGKVAANDITKAFIVDDYNEVSSTSYEIYTGDVYWKSYRDNGPYDVPTGAVVVGYGKEGEPIFAALGKYGNGWYPGRLNLNFEFAIITVDGVPQYPKEYKVLISKTQTIGDKNKSGKTEVQEPAPKSKK